MRIQEVQACDEYEPEAMMIHVIDTSVLADETVKSAVVQIVRKNALLSMESPQECVHLKFVLRV